MTTQAAFDTWVDEARRSARTLDADAYAALAKPSCKVPASYYAGVEPELFAGIVSAYNGPPAQDGSP